MLRLFPRSWFNRSNPAQRAHAEQADALQTHWRSWLAKGIARVVSDEAIDASSAVARLQGLPPVRFLQLDQVLRHGWWDLSEAPDEPRDLPLAAIDARRPDADAYLFVASAHPNGFVREQAISAFRHYPGRLAMAAALIRCDDWVGKVRSAASERLVHLIGESSGIEMIELLLTEAPMSMAILVAVVSWPFNVPTMRSRMIISCFVYWRLSGAASMSVSCVRP